MTANNLVLKFLLELAAFAAFAFWGAGVSVLLAVAAPTAAILLWGTLAAPKSARRLPDRARIPFELAVFGLATAALAATASAALAIAFGVLVAANAVLLTTLGEWEH